MLLSLHLRSQANIHGRPTDESSISSKSAVHFLKMIHLRDFAPFICFSFSEWRILFLLFSDFANSTMESSPTKYPTEAQDATRWTHGYRYNHINQVIAHLFCNHFSNSTILKFYIIIVNSSHVCSWQLFPLTFWLELVTNQLTPCVSAGLIPRWCPPTGSASPRSVSRLSCMAGITSHRKQNKARLLHAPAAAAAAPATPAPGRALCWTTLSLISQAQTNKFPNNLSKLHCVPPSHNNTETYLFDTNRSRDGAFFQCQPFRKSS